MIAGSVEPSWFVPNPKYNVNLQWHWTIEPMTVSYSFYPFSLVQNVQKLISIEYEDGMGREDHFEHDDYFGNTVHSDDDSNIIQDGPALPIRLLPQPLEEDAGINVVQPDYPNIPLHLYARSHHANDNERGDDPEVSISPYLVINKLIEFVL